MAVKKETYTEKPPEKNADDVKKTIEEKDSPDVSNSPEYVTKADLKDFGETMGKSITESLLTIFTRSKIQEMRTDAIRQNKPISLDEIKNHHGIEPMDENDLIKDQVELEGFMNEFVVIDVQPPTEEGDLDIVTPNVNGWNQPIIRGVPTKVRRKYVEVLARCRSTDYTQKNMDKSDPTNLKMVPRTKMSYPFQVLEDRNPKGRDWFKRLLNEAH